MHRTDAAQQSQSQRHSSGMIRFTVEIPRPKSEGEQSEGVVKMKWSTAREEVTGSLTNESLLSSERGERASNNFVRRGG